MSLLIPFAARAQPVTTTPSGPLHVYVSNLKAASPLVWETMRIETEEIMTQAGVGLAWHAGGGNVPGRLAVVRLQGECRADAALPFALAVSGASTDPEALGKTHVSNGEVLPFADIRCDQVRKFILNPMRGGASAAAREQMLGRALARVVAHELYHILLRTQRHGKTGIAKASQTAAQLVAPRIAFSRVEERKLAAEIHGEDAAGDAAADGDDSRLRR